LAPDVLGRGKKSLALNLKNPTAIEIVLKLCDIVRKERNKMVCLENSSNALHSFRLM
jgi:hypothetical protein